MVEGWLVGGGFQVIMQWQALVSKKHLAAAEIYRAQTLM